MRLVNVCFLTCALVPSHGGVFVKRASGEKTGNETWNHQPIFAAMHIFKFKDFESFFEALLPSEKSIVARLRELILGHFPEMREKFAYGVPYYWLHGRVCFMYPASFPYSGLAEGVSLGFARGHLLSNEQGLLQMGDRKEVGYVVLRSPGDIQEEPLLEMLHEAVLIDEELKREKQLKS